MTVATLARPRSRLGKIAKSSVERMPPPEILGQIHRLTVGQFQKMIEAGIFPAGERIELLNGWLYKKMTQHPPHAVVLDLAQGNLRPLLPAGWCLREQKPIVTRDSHPEPDIAVVRGHAKHYIRQHPQPKDIGLLVEVSDSTLDYDRELKGICYAQARIPIYWIINLQTCKVEVYTHPKGGKSPSYRQREDYGPEDSIPLILDGKVVASVPVRDLFVLPREVA